MSRLVQSQTIKISKRKTYKTYKHSMKDGVAAGTISYKHDMKAYSLEECNAATEASKLQSSEPY